MDKLILAPHYTGSLKYLEKLIPHLKRKYEILFVFLPKIRSQYLLEMVEYCQNKNYAYLKIEVKNCNSVIKHLAQKLEYKKNITNVLKRIKPQRIVVISDSDFWDAVLVEEANRLGIETLLLQWAIALPPAIKSAMDQELAEKSIVDNLDSKKKDNFLKSYLNSFTQQLLGLPRQHPRLFGSGEAKKIGVINNFTANFLTKLGINKEKIAVVGHIDFDHAKETFDSLRNNQEKREMVAAKLSINQTKKNIIIFASTPFYTKDMTIMEPADQVKYYEKIINSIRLVFSPAEADIHFKIHPAEDVKLYEPLARQGIKIYDKNTNNEELIFFADLYISHHSTTNFIAMIMKKPIIFLNLINLEFINYFTDVTGAKEFINSEKTFIEKLKKFKSENSLLDYNLNSVSTDGKNVERIVKWIN